MSVLFIAGRFPPENDDLRRYLLRVSTAISKQTETTVLTTKTKGWKDYDRNIDIEIVRAGREKGNILKVIPLNRKAARLVSSKKIEHIIASTWNAAGTTAMNLYTRMKIPYSIIVFGQDIRRYIRHQTIAKRVSLVLNNAKNVFVTSEYTAKLVRWLKIDDKKIKIIRAGGDPIENKVEAKSENLNELRRSHGADAPKKLILSIGKLETMKAFDILIWSVFLLSKKNNSFKLLITGDGADKKKLNTIIGDLKIEDYVDIIPNVESLENYYQACDLYVLLGRGVKYGLEDGLGLSLYEAAYHEKPVIAANSGALPEAVVNEKTGLVVPPLQPKETAEAMHKLLSSEKLLSKMGRQGRIRISKNYTWQAVADRIIDNIM